MIDREGYLVPPRVLSDGRVLDVMPLTFGRARLVISESIDAPGYLDGY